MTFTHKLSNGYKIRKFTDADLDKIVAINRVCLPENYSPIFFMDLYRSFPDAFLVGEYNEEIIGYAMSRIEFGLSEAKRFRFTHKGHIVSVAVMPEHRCKKIALAMLEEVLKVMTERYKCNETYLEVRVSNHTAINLYQKMGYSIIKNIPYYYIDGETAAVMFRTLPLETLSDDIKKST